MKNKSFEGGRVAKKNLEKEFQKSSKEKSDAYFLEKFSRKLCENFRLSFE
jgi:hypothetical protein